MIAPQTAMNIEPGSGHDVVRANQLIEAGLWLHLGGDSEGARRLFTRALSHDPTNRRAREWLVKINAARPATPVKGVPPPTVQPVSVPPAGARASRPSRPAASVAAQPALEVSVILLEEEEVASPGAAEANPHITADVLAFLSEPGASQPASTPKPAPARAGTPASVPAPARAVTPASVPVPARAVTPAPVPVPRMDPQQELATLLQGVGDLLSLGDMSSAMELLRKAEQLAPGGDARVVAARERCAREQQTALEAKLGDLKRVPMLKLRMAELMKLSLDPRAGFLLSRIDGRLSYESLFAVSGMSRLDTMRVLVQLLDQDIIAVR